MGCLNLLINVLFVSLELNVAFNSYGHSTADSEKIKKKSRKKIKVIQARIKILMKHGNLMFIQINTLYRVQI